MSDAIDTNISIKTQFLVNANAKIQRPLRSEAEKGRPVEALQDRNELE